MTTRKKKSVRPPEPFWNEFVSIWFSYCKEKFNEIPTFDGSSPRDLKSIIITLRKRCEQSGHEWNSEAATMRFRHFLDYCFQDRWLSENWMLSNLNRQKEKIFFNIAKQRNG